MNLASLVAFIAFCLAGFGHLGRTNYHGKINVSRGHCPVFLNKECPLERDWVTVECPSNYTASGWNSSQYGYPPKTDWAMPKDRTHPNYFSTSIHDIMTIIPIIGTIYSSIVVLVLKWIIISAEAWVDIWHPLPLKERPRVIGLNGSTTAFVFLLVLAQFTFRGHLIGKTSNVKPIYVGSFRPLFNATIFTHVSTRPHSVAFNQSHELNRSGQYQFLGGNRAT